MYVSAEPSRREHQIDQRIDKIRSINLSLTYIYIKHVIIESGIDSPNFSVLTHWLVRSL